MYILCPNLYVIRIFRAVMISTQSVSGVFFGSVLQFYRNVHVFIFYYIHPSFTLQSSSALSIRRDFSPTRIWFPATSILALHLRDPVYFIPMTASSNMWQLLLCGNSLKVPVHFTHAYINAVTIFEGGTVAVFPGTERKSFYHLTLSWVPYHVLCTEALRSWVWTWTDQLRKAPRQLQWNFRPIFDVWDSISWVLTRNSFCTTSAIAVSLRSFNQWRRRLFWRRTSANQNYGVSAK